MAISMGDSPRFTSIAALGAGPLVVVGVVVGVGWVGARNVRRVALVQVRRVVPLCRGAKSV